MTIITGSIIEGCQTILLNPLVGNLGNFTGALAAGPLFEVGFNDRPSIVRVNVNLALLGCLEDDVIGNIRLPCNFITFMFEGEGVNFTNGLALGNILRADNDWFTASSTSNAWSSRP